eukprot:1000760_1
MEVLALLLGVAAATWHKTYTLKNIKTIDTLSTFNEWAQAFDRIYENMEVESAKYMVWLDNLYIIAASNSMNKSYTLGLNQFSDMTSDEFKYYIHGDEGAFSLHKNANIIFLIQLVKIYSFQMMLLQLQTVLIGQQKVL